MEYLFTMMRAEAGGLQSSDLITQRGINVSADQRRSAEVRAQEMRPGRRGRVGDSGCGALLRKVRQSPRRRGAPTQNPPLWQEIPILSRTEHCARPAHSRYSEVQGHR